MQIINFSSPSSAVIEDLKAKVALKQNKDNNTDLNTQSKSIVPAINEVLARATGSSIALVYTDYSNAISGLKTFEPDVLPIGTNVFVEQLNVPDLWASHVDDTFHDYTYTSDEDFVNALSQGGIWIGYYKVNQLESGGEKTTVLYTPQILNDSEKAQARTNIGLGDISTHSTSEFATSAQGAKADSALQASDIVDDLGSLASNKPISARAVNEDMVNYIDGSISNTLTYVDQQDANEHAGRVAGDNLLSSRITVLEDGTVRHDIEQSLSDSEKEQARENINAADASDVYSKSEIDSALGLKADKSNTYTKNEVDSSLGLKADKSTTYTKTETDSLLNNKADKSTTYTKTEVDTSLNLKADKSTTYTKTEVDGFLNNKADADDVTTALNLKADKATTYTKTEVDTALNFKADKSTTYTKNEVDASLTLKADKSTTYTKTETDSLLANKADSNTVYTKTQTDSLLNNKADKSTTYTKTETNNLLNDKADKADTYTKEEVDEKITETDNKIDNLQDDLETGNIVVGATKNIQTADAIIVEDKAIITTTGGDKDVNPAEAGFKANLTNIKGSSEVTNDFVHSAITNNYTPAEGDTYNFQVNIIDANKFTAAVIDNNLAGNTIALATVLSWISLDYGLQTSGTSIGTETFKVTNPTYQTVAFPTITSFNSTQWNLLTSNTAKIIKGHRYMIVASSGTPTATINSESQSISSYTCERGHTIPYSFIATATGTCTFTNTSKVALVWSGKYCERTTDTTYSLSTITIPSTYRTLRAVGSTYDELTPTAYHQRIFSLATNGTNLINTADNERVITSSYIYYTNSVETTELSLDWSFNANDFGEVYFEFSANPMPIQFTTVYGTNLVDKLVRDVLTVSEQDLNESEKTQVHTNLGLQHTVFTVTYDDGTTGAINLVGYVE